MAQRPAPCTSACSASKARVVLNLIRGLPVKRADEVLQFSDREVSNDIRKVLASAVANAQHNDEQDPDELFVKACFADEGPTLKRFTPRARGRGNRINKRTCHITIVIARLDDARLEVVQAREAKRTASGRRRPAAGGTSASRRARVERSRQRAAEARGGKVGDAQDLKRTRSRRSSRRAVDERGRRTRSRRRRDRRRRRRSTDDRCCSRERSATTSRAAHDRSVARRRDRRRAEAPATRHERRRRRKRSG